MKQFEILSGRCLVVEIPEGATDAKINPVNSWRQELACWDGHRWKDVSLPKGNWRIIGVLSEVTEDDLTDVIDVLVSSESGKNLYPNLTGGPWKVSRIESLESAILAENWYFENPYTGVGIKTAYSEYRRNEYQSRVLNRSRCLLLGRES